MNKNLVPIALNIVDITSIHRPNAMRVIKEVRKLCANMTRMRGQPRVRVALDVMIIDFKPHCSEIILRSTASKRINIFIDEYRLNSDTSCNWRIHRGDTRKDDTGTCLLSEVPILLWLRWLTTFPELNEVTNCPIPSLADVESDPKAEQSLEMAPSQQTAYE